MIACRAFAAVANRFSEQMRPTGADYARNPDQKKRFQKQFLSTGRIDDDSWLNRAKL